MLGGGLDSKQSRETPSSPPQISSDFAGLLRNLRGTASEILLGLTVQIVDTVDHKLRNAAPCRAQKLKVRGATGDGPDSA